MRLFYQALLFLLLSSQVFSEHQFIIKGSNTIGAQLAPECAKQFLRHQGIVNVSIRRGDINNEYIVSGIDQSTPTFSSVSIKIAAHGSSTGFMGLIDRSADLAMSSRPIKKDEQKALLSRGNMLDFESEHVIAIDGLAILVHPNNPLEQLSIEQIAQIFAGELTHWQQLGGIDLPIEIYARDQYSGTWDTFKKLVLKKDFQLSRFAKRFESNNVLSDAVANNPKAIGFTGLASVRDAKLLAVSDQDTQAIKPNVFSVATEDYPLSRRLYFYLPQDLQKHQVKAFVEFCLSQQGQIIVDEVGFVAQRLQQQKVSVAQNAPETYQQLARLAQRLSLNFRFAFGSPNLDNKAHRDIERLTDFIRSNFTVKPYIYLVGFSDASNRFSEDLVLSRFRALAVRSALLRNGIEVETSFGLGSFMPVVNNQGKEKKKNGRVEVWLSEKPLQLGS